MRHLLCVLLALCLASPGRARAQEEPVPADVPEGDAVFRPFTMDLAADWDDDQAGRDDRWVIGGEYLVWWLREGRIPAILTTSSPASQGRLGSGDTVVLYGDQRLETRHDDRFVGTRVTLGYWLDDEQTWEVEGDAFFLERDSTYFKATSAGNVLLARPWTDAVTGQAMSDIIAGPSPAGVLSGGFVGYSRVELFGEQANVVATLGQGEHFRWGVLAGAHFLQMRDRLDLTATSQLLPDETTLYGLTDHYRADSRFFGGQGGLRAEYAAGIWSADLRGEAALGGTEQIIRNFGETIDQTPLQRVDLPFGATVLPSDTGRFEHTVLDAVYELGADAGCQLTRHLRLFTGYTFLYWTRPIRAGDQVDLSANPSQTTGPLTGPARPGVPFRTDHFWAQGVNVGLQVGW